MLVFQEFTYSCNIFVGCSTVQQTVTAPIGENKIITSPNISPLNYSSDLECTWLIEAGSRFDGYIVKVTFNDIQLEGPSGSTASCWDDRLNFYDGTSTIYVLGSYCGTVHPEVIYSTGRHLYVKFYSDSFTTRKRFSINVLAVIKGNLFAFLILFVPSGT